MVWHQRETALWLWSKFGEKKSAGAIGVTGAGGEEWQSASSYFQRYQAKNGTGTGEFAGKSNFYRSQLPKAHVTEYHPREN